MHCCQEQKTSWNFVGFSPCCGVIDTWACLSQFHSAHEMFPQASAWRSLLFQRASPKHSLSLTVSLSLRSHHIKSPCSDYGHLPAELSALVLYFDRGRPLQTAFLDMTCGDPSRPGNLKAHLSEAGHLLHPTLSITKFAMAFLSAFHRHHYLAEEDPQKIRARILKKLFSLSPVSQLQT